MSSSETLEQLARLCRNGRAGPPPRIEPSGPARLDAVAHVVATEVEDYSHWVRTLPRKSRDFH